MKTVVVLGMHCSATSLLSEGLAKCTVDMGCGPGSNNCGFNPWGVWEDLRIRLLNDKILEIAGGSWDNPPTEARIIAAGKIVQNEIKSILALRKKEAAANGKKLWGWKDPRTTLTIKCFIGFLENPHFFSSIREPVEVTKSLMRRNGMSGKQASDLVKEYNRRLIEFLAERI